MQTVDSNFGLKLKKRREEREMSLQYLGNQIGLSKQSIHRFENGEQLPSTPILLKLSEYLNVLPTFFFEDDTINIEINNIRFRNEEKINKETFNLNKIKDFCKSELLKFIELEEILKVKNDFINPLEGLKIKSVKDIEKAAKKIRRKWRLGYAPISDVTELIEDKGIYIIEVDLTKDFNGFNGWANNNIPLIIINSNFDEITRKRFTLLHELGHIVLDFIDNLSEKKIEEFCNHFAGAVLLVDDTLEQELGKNRTLVYLSELKMIKEKYGISIYSIMVRAMATKYITFDSYHKWKELYKEWRENSLNFGDYKGNEEPQVFMQLITRGISEQKITWGKASEFTGKKIDYLQREYNNKPNVILC